MNMKKDFRSVADILWHEPAARARKVRAAGAVSALCATGASIAILTPGLLIARALHQTPSLSVACVLATLMLTAGVAIKTDKAVYRRALGDGVPTAKPIW